MVTPEAIFEQLAETHALLKTDVVQMRPFLGYRCRAETAGPRWLDFDWKAVL
jgi:hypothetical protein